MTEMFRQLCESLIHWLPLPNKTSGLYFLAHCKIAGWAMFVGDSGKPAHDEDLPF